jgi:hypothetical protein
MTRVNTSQSESSFIEQLDIDVPIFDRFDSGVHRVLARVVSHGVGGEAVENGVGERVV